MRREKRTTNESSRGDGVPRLRSWGDLCLGLPKAVWQLAQRFDRALNVSREEEIRDWWRAHQAKQRAYWARRGYTDARLAQNGYPHHGGCQCEWCKAYWWGYRRYQRALQPPQPAIATPTSARRPVSQRPGQSAVPLAEREAQPSAPRLFSIPGGRRSNVERQQESSPAANDHR